MQLIFLRINFVGQIMLNKVINVLMYLNTILALSLAAVRNYQYVNVIHDTYLLTINCIKSCCFF